MRRVIGTTAMVVSVLLVFSGLFSASATVGTNADLKDRLIACGSIPNRSTLTVVQTTRIFINLPREYFPNIKLTMKSLGASATTVSNGGKYGYAIGAQGKPNCWSYYFDFELTANNKAKRGTVDIRSKSAFKSISNYLIHFIVVATPPDATKQVAGNGSVRGRVLLGPVCPVERIPPDPACAPKPYKTTIDIWSTVTGSTYKPVATNAAGQFRLSLAPGSYGLKVSAHSEAALYPRCSEVAFVVVAKKSQDVTVNCDTGIR